MAGSPLPLALLLALLAGGAMALYEKGGPVVLLTHRSFDAVTGSKVPVIVVRARQNRQPAAAAHCPRHTSSRPLRLTRG